jgi:hypothetical protein
MPANTSALFFQGTTAAIGGAGAGRASVTVCVAPAVPVDPPRHEDQQRAGMSFYPVGADQSISSASVQ